MVKKVISRAIAVIALAGLLLIPVSSQAALIGLKGKLLYPDILFNTVGKINFTAGSTFGSFVLSAFDRTMTMSDGTEYYLTGPGFTTTMSLTIDVDSSGNLVGTGKMEEKVVLGEVVIGNETFGAGTVILAGDVYAFGWGEGALLGQFDFLLNNLSGGLITAGIWPSNAPTGIWSLAENLWGWNGNWNKNFLLTKVKGDKAPVPIPTTVLLLASGILGLVGLKRKFIK